MNKNARLFIIGGTGFIGSHTTLLALKEGYRVSLLSRSLPEPPDLFPDTVNLFKGDASLLPETNLEEMFRDHSVVVYAIGADDKYLPPKPAYSHFYFHNVETTAKVYRSAKKAGVKKMIILGSYFCYFNRQWPDMQLTTYHPYIRSRVEQEKFACENSTRDLEIIVLELPYIFGSIKGRSPLWKPLINYILSNKPLFYMRGGSNMISVKQVAAAIIGAVKWGKGGNCYTIGDQNLSWIELINKILMYGKKKKNIIIVPDWILKTGGSLLHLVLSLRGKESGLHPRMFMEIQTKDAFFDPSFSQKALHIQGGGLDDAIRETVIACNPEKYSETDRLILP